ncbi:PQQ-binding-like beta-propeller repeat protein [Halobacteriovorax sp. HLS]|uniref:outer membrane protein assembly factor BamB family protein n=1 Tax=Halobacteriovorax sp. HLS TaxID=2234000 RepID=UPI000FD78FCA|nr:PQQ-binding-like beta-propeller repeat protein [Halobacteriovorax sp. HLS]
MHKLLIATLLCLAYSCSKLPTIEGVREKENPFRVMWSKNHDPAHETGNLPIALNSPLIHEGIVYVGNNNGHMQAFQLDNGKEIWSKFDDSAYSSKPVIYKDWVVYGNSNGRVFSRHLLTGKEQFLVDLGSAIETQGVIYKERVFFQTRNHKVFCLDVNTGKIQWSYKRAVPFLTTVQRASRPFIYKDKVYVGFADGQIAAFSLEEGVILWERRLSTGAKFVDVDSSPIIFRDNIIAGSVNGDLAVIDPETGAILRRLDYKVSRYPVEHKGQLLVSTIFGDVILLDKNLMEIKRVKIGDGPMSSIIPWKGSLVASSVTQEIVLLDEETLDIKAEFFLGHTFSGILGELDEQENYLAALSSRNRLYIFK